MTCASCARVFCSPVEIGSSGTMGECPSCGMVYVRDGAGDPWRIVPPAVVAVVVAAAAQILEQHLESSNG